MQLVVEHVFGPDELDDDTLSDVPEYHVGEEEEKGDETMERYVIIL